MFKLELFRDENPKYYIEMLLKVVNLIIFALMMEFLNVRENIMNRWILHLYQSENLLSWT